MSTEFAGFIKYLILNASAEGASAFFRSNYFKIKTFHFLMSYQIWIEKRTGNGFTLGARQYLQSTKQMRTAHM